MNETERKKNGSIWQTRNIKNQSTECWLKLSKMACWQLRRWSFVKEMCQVIHCEFFRCSEQSIGVKCPATASNPMPSQWLIGNLMWSSNPAVSRPLGRRNLICHFLPAPWRSRCMSQLIAMCLLWQVDPLGRRRRQRQLASNFVNNWPTGRFRSAGRMGKGKVKGEMDVLECWISRRWWGWEWTKLWQK